MPVEDFSGLSFSETLATQVKRGRMFHDEIISVAQRTAGHASKHRPGETPTLPRLVLRLDLLEPGDVLLMRGDGDESKRIAKFSGGDFSHAALWIDPITTLESDGELIGPKHARCFGTATLDGEPVALGEIVGAPLTCEVYRHPGMSKLTVEEFTAALEAEMIASYGKDYSEYYRLVTLGRIPDMPMLSQYLVPLAAEVTRAYERRFVRDKIHGPFCSELVARVFQHAGLPLFNDYQPAEQISPNDLARSALNHIDGAVVDPSRLKDIYHDEDELTDFLVGLEHTLVTTRREQRGAEITFNEATELSKWLKDKTRQTTEQITILYAAQVENVRYILEESRHLGEPYLIDRAFRLAERYAKLTPQLITSWRNEQRTLEDVEQSREDMKRLSRSLIRCQMLLTIHRFKRQVRVTKPSALLSRFRNLRWRRRLFRLIKSHRPA